MPGLVPGTALPGSRFSAGFEGPGLVNLHPIRPLLHPLESTEKPNSGASTAILHGRGQWKCQSSDSRAHEEDLFTPQSFEFLCVESVCGIRICIRSRICRTSIKARCLNGGSRSQCSCTGVAVPPRR
jgi:hypothetical protein